MNPELLKQLKGLKSLKVLDEDFDATKFPTEMFDDTFSLDKFEIEQYCSSTLQLPQCMDNILMKEFTTHHKLTTVNVNRYFDTHRMFAFAYGVDLSEITGRVHWQSKAEKMKQRMMSVLGERYHIQKFDAEYIEESEWSKRYTTYSDMKFHLVDQTTGNKLLVLFKDLKPQEKQEDEDDNEE